MFVMMTNAAITVSKIHVHKSSTAILLVAFRNDGFAIKRRIVKTVSMKKIAVSIYHCSY